MSGVLAPSRRLPPPVAADPSLAGTLRLRPLAAAWWSRVAPPLVSAPALCLCGTPAPSWERRACEAAGVAPRRPSGSAVLQSAFDIWRATSLSSGAPREGRPTGANPVPRPPTEPHHAAFVCSCQTCHREAFARQGRAASDPLAEARPVASVQEKRGRPPVRGECLRRSSCRTSFPVLRSGGGRHRRPLRASSRGPIVQRGVAPAILPPERVVRPSSGRSKWQSR